MVDAKAHLLTVQTPPYISSCCDNATMVDAKAHLRTVQTTHLHLLL